MGQAKIINHIAAGQYNVQIQYAHELMDARIALLTSNVAAYEAQIITDQAAYDTLQLEYDSIILTLVGITDYDEASHYQSSTAYPAKFALDSALTSLNLLKLQLEAAQNELDLLNDEAARADETVRLWCTEYNEDLVADTLVQTIEVDYESPSIANQQNWPIVITPNAWDSFKDGKLQSVLSADAWSHLYNRIVSVAAMLASPRYRVGNVTEKSGTKLTVELLAAYSNEKQEGHLQGYDINEDTTLPNLPVDYMTCGADAFEVGDAVVVKYPPVNLYSQIQAKYVGLVAEVATKIADKDALVPTYEADVATSLAVYNDLEDQQNYYINLLNTETDPDLLDSYAGFLALLQPQLMSADLDYQDANTKLSLLNIEIQSLNQLSTQYQTIADTNAAKSAQFVQDPTVKTVIGFARNPRQCPVEWPDITIDAVFNTGDVVNAGWVTQFGTDVICFPGDPDLEAGYSYSTTESSYWFEKTAPSITVPSGFTLISYPTELTVRQAYPGTAGKRAYVSASDQTTSYNVVNSESIAFVTQYEQIVRTWASPFDTICDGSIYISGSPSSTVTTTISGATLTPTTTPIVIQHDETGQTHNLSCTSNTVSGEFVFTPD